MRRRWDRHFVLYARYAGLGVLAVLLRADGAAPPAPPDVIAAIERAQQRREQTITGLSAVEHYTVRNSHFKEAAEMAAQVTYARGSGKNYRVLWRKGPEILQKQVLTRILNEEAMLSRGSRRQDVLLTSANYWMTVQGTQILRGRPCFLVKISPKQRKFWLIEGFAWFDERDFSLLRVEAKPAVSPSFWTGRPLLERDYAVVSGFSFPQRSRATSSGFFAGKSELTIEYQNYVISKR